jgi:fermentation-respiration switch protein FrsA (DUF1100 family)
VVRVVGVVVIVMAVGLGALWALQRQLIYLPDSSSVPSAAGVIDGGQDVPLHTEDDLELGAWFFPEPDDDTARGYAVVVFPGNAGNRLGRADFGQHLHERGFAVLLVDYRGYGGNPGRPTEEGLAHDADAAVAALAELDYPPERTLYFGESLGTGVSAALAERTPPAGIVLRSPFTSLVDVGAHHYPFLPVRTALRDRYPVLEPLGGSDVPVTVIRGSEDRVIPTRMSAEVAAAAPNLVEELVLEGVDHNDAEMFGAPVADAVVRMADHLDALK